MGMFAVTLSFGLFFPLTPLSLGLRWSLFSMQLEGEKQVMQPTFLPLSDLHTHVFLPPFGGHVGCVYKRHPLSVEEHQLACRVSKMRFLLLLLSIISSALLAEMGGLTRRGGTAVFLRQSSKMGLLLISLTIISSTLPVEACTKVFTVPRMDYDYEGMNVFDDEKLEEYFLEFGRFLSM